MICMRPKKQCGADQKCEPGALCEACPSKLLDPKGLFQRRLAEHGGLTVVCAVAYGMVLICREAPYFYLQWAVRHAHHTTPSLRCYQQRIANVHRIPDGDAVTPPMDVDLIVFQTGPPWYQGRYHTSPHLASFILKTRTAISYHQRTCRSMTTSGIMVQRCPLRFRVHAASAGFIGFLL